MVRQFYQYVSNELQAHEFILLVCKFLYTFRVSSVLIILLNSNMTVPMNKLDWKDLKLLRQGFQKPICLDFRIFRAHGDSNCNNSIEIHPCHHRLCNQHDLKES